MDLEDLKDATEDQLLHEVVCLRFQLAGARRRIESYATSLSDAQAEIVSLRQQNSSLREQAARTTLELVRARERGRKASGVIRVVGALPRAGSA